MRFDDSAIRTGESNHGVKRGLFAPGSLPLWSRAHSQLSLARIWRNAANLRHTGILGLANAKSPQLISEEE